MAKISTPDIQVGEGGTGFSKPYIERAVSAGPAQLNNLANVGLDLFKHHKREVAKGEAQSLLERFTGRNQLNAIYDQDAELRNREMDVDVMMENPSLHEGVFAEAAQEKAAILRARGELEKKALAVEQGLMSFEDYRREAEMLFYQQVSMTPGLKDELAQAMGEFLHIDPRGQTAAIEIEKRKAAAQNNRDLLSKMRGEMQELGLWDESPAVSDEQNFAKFAPAYKRYKRRMADLALDAKEADKIKRMDEQQQTIRARQAAKDMIGMQPYLFKAMATFGENNAYGMDAGSFAKLDKDVRVQWRRKLSETKDRALGEIAKYKMIFQGKIDTQPMVDQLNRHFESLDSLVSGTMSQEAAQTELEILKISNDMQVEAEKSNLFIDYPTARTLAALKDTIGGETLAANATLSGISADLLRQRTQDLTAINAEERAEQLQSYQFLMQKMRNGYKQGAKITDEHVQNHGAIVQTILARQPDELDDKTRRQALALVAQDGFMDRLKDVNPRSFDIISDSIQPHIQNLQQNLAIDLERRAQASNLKVAPVDFFLKKEGDMWLVAPTTEISEFTPRVGKGPAAKSSSSINKAAQAKHDAEIQQLMAGLNNERTGNWNNMVRAKAKTLLISEMEAARQISAEMGMSLKDRTTSAADKTVGFAESAGVTNTQQEKVDPTLQLMKELADSVPGATLEEIKEFIEKQRGG